MAEKDKSNKGEEVKASDEKVNKEIAEKTDKGNKAPQEEALNTDNKTDVVNNENSSNADTEGDSEKAKQKPKKQIVYEPEKKSLSNQSRIALRIIFGVIAVGAAIATLLLSPMGKRLTGQKDKITNDQITQGVVVETKKETTTLKPAETEIEKETQIPNNFPSITVPKPTEPTTNPYKNYSVFIDKKNYDYTEIQGVTTIVSKENEKASLVIKPLPPVPYGDLCKTYRDEDFKELSNVEKVKIASLNTAFTKEESGYITTIYCVDDGNGGSIEIKCRYPKADDKYKTQFDMMISMFKVHSAN